MVQAAAGALLVLFVCTAAWWDATADRIPNPLTVGGLLVALALRALLGIDHVLQGLGGFGIGFGIALVLYLLRAIGGGDVKLLAAVGAFLGSSEILGALGLIAVLGAAFALVVVSRRGLLPLLVVNTVDLIKGWLTLGSAAPIRKEAVPLLTIPYGVPIAIGTLIWWFGETVRL
ncbi:MAG TPA: prepilin peptidase [Gemmatimonadales bacterium]|nr:prepilin peptidase [Gemmatimonadales bacterium]